MTTMIFGKNAAFFIHPTDLFSNGLKAYVMLVHLQRDPAIAFEIFRLEIFLWSLVFQWEMKNLPKIMNWVVGLFIVNMDLYQGLHSFLPKCTFKGMFITKEAIKESIWLLLLLWGWFFLMAFKSFEILHIGCGVQKPFQTIWRRNFLIYDLIGIKKQVTTFLGKKEVPIVIKICLVMGLNLG